MTNPRKPVPDGGGGNLKRNPLKGAPKTARIPIKPVPRADTLPKPGWLRVKAPSGAEVLPLKEVLHANRRHTVCEEAGRPSLAEFKTAHPHIPTKSGLVAGMGERNDEVVAAIRNRRAHGCDLLTIGQYLQPGGARLAIERCVYPDESARTGQELGFRHVASGPLVHSSCHYHAEHQARSL